MKCSPVERWNALWPPPLHPNYHSWALIVQMHLSLLQHGNHGNTRRARMNSLCLLTFLPLAFFLLCGFFSSSVIATASIMLSVIPYYPSYPYYLPLFCIIWSLCYNFGFTGLDLPGMSCWSVLVTMWACVALCLGHVAPAADGLAYSALLKNELLGAGIEKVQDPQTEDRRLQPSTPEKRSLFSVSGVS